MILGLDSPALLAILPALLLPLAGCSGTVFEDGNSTVKVDAEELRVSTLDTMNNVSTVSVESNVTARAEGSTALEVTLDGVVNVEDQRARSDLREDQLGETIEGEQYLIHETLYLGADALGGWIK